MQSLVERTWTLFFIIPNVPLSSPSHNLFKQYSPPPFEKSEPPEPSEPNSPKSVISDGEGEDKTLRQWATQEVTQQPLYITFPEAHNFDLKSRLIHLVPTFIGLENEDPHKFLKEFHVVCSGMRPHAITEYQIKLRAFQFLLQDSTREWLYELLSGSITTWNELAKLFLFSRNMSFEPSVRDPWYQIRNKRSFAYILGALQKATCSVPTTHNQRLPTL